VKNQKSRTFEKNQKMKLPHPIPYQGSKRNLADKILSYFPLKVNRLFEPFAGSAAITIASAYYCKANHFIINDINEPLIKLWDKIINNPDQIIGEYHHIWNNQIGKEEAYYYEAREMFNNTQQPEYLLFMLAKCVKAAVRYNSNGEFNQSPDKRRLGRTPSNMREDIIKVSQLLKSKVTLLSLDYEEAIATVNEDDLIYFDPPYQGTGQNGGFRYMQDLNHDDFVLSLFQLNKKNIPFLLSYDGRTGDKHFGKPLPDALNLTKIEIDAGRSSIATLLNRVENTYEALYISPSLMNIKCAHQPS
jgi:DNA adenine methylase